MKEGKKYEKSWRNMRTVGEIWMNMRNMKKVEEIRKLQNYEETFIRNMKKHEKYEES